MADKKEDLQQFARDLGIEEIPDAWQRHWPAFSASGRVGNAHLSVGAA